MALYLGDTEVAPVIEVPVPEKKYGVPIGGLLGDIDENGQLQDPTEPFTPDLSGIKSLVQPILKYKFFRTGASGDIVLGIESMNFDEYMMYCFTGCQGLTSVSFPALTEIVTGRAMSYAFGSCTSLTSVSFPALVTISGSRAMVSAFDGCTNLTSVSFPALTTISGSQAMVSAFYYCTALTEIHFRADAQATIEAMTGYADKWGATNATIYFDL